MKHDDYFKELSRILSKNGNETGCAESNQRSVLKDGEPAFRVESGGFLSFMLGDPERSGTDELYHQVASVAAEVHEYLTVMDNAPLLVADSLDEEYKLLADFNGYVLAGRQTENNYGCKFVTWQWNYNRTGVTLGHYFIDDYAAAKQDFAIRTGLIQKEKLFTPEQLTAMYRRMDNVLEGTDDNLTYEEEKALQSMKEKIEDLVPDLSERIANIEHVNDSSQQTM